jgi:hypothetical protein
MYNYPNYNMLSPYPQQQSAGLIRVTGMDGAKMYQLSPNSAVALFDANEDIFYIKTTDGAGFPTIRSYKFAPIDMQNQINQLQLQSALAGVVRYPNGFVYNAGNNPFCGCGTGCGCNI